MAGRKIIWSPVAKRKLFLILEYFIERNQSNTYSLKLYNLFQKELTLLEHNPDIGIKTDLANIRGLIVSDYTLFYEVTDTNITVQTIWDNRQDPDDLKIK
jgi:plasmid stabilization system protein ParE